MNILKYVIPPFLSNRYVKLQSRLRNLENSVRLLDLAVDTMLLNPKYTPSDDAGFNGQRERKKIFGEIINAIAFDAFIETGCWLGDTTAYIRQTGGKPVCSCEINRRFFALAKTRLAGIDDIHLELKDSRKFLEGLRQSVASESTLFFYLDAHWYEDLPLEGEIDLIGSSWKQSVIMIDDFQVPDDDGYYFDKYGGNSLNLDLISKSIKQHNLDVFFPSARSSEEPVGKCGCVILAPKGALSGKLSQLQSLRRWDTK